MSAGQDDPDISLEDIIDLDDIRKAGLDALDLNTTAHYTSGANDRYTLNENVKAFQRLRIRPRVFVNVEHIDMSVDVIGGRMSFPCGSAPTGLNRMAHPDGEIAVSKALSKTNRDVAMILSTMSTSSLEEVAESSGPDSLRWFQLYVNRDRSISENMVRRAEKAGYKALVITLDAMYRGSREPERRFKSEFPSDLRLGNFEGSMQRIRHKTQEIRYITRDNDKTLTWDDVKWFRSITKMPIILKAVLTREDAVLAVHHGIDGIIVSNHGGRQLDSVPAAIEALPEIVEGVDGKADVYLDGGVRRGTDIFKALALGAKAVFIGRPFMYGLAMGGQKGVEKVFDILEKELHYAMALAGCPTVKDITRSHVAYHRDYYSRL